jgi:hypothetical protein
MGLGYMSKSNTIICTVLYLKYLHLSAAAVLTDSMDSEKKLAGFWEIL